MATTMISDWISQTYEDDSSNVSSKKTVNMYFQSTEGEGKAPAILLGTPGTATFTREEQTPFNIESIQGSGDQPNFVTITATDHGMSAGQLFNVTGTLYYDELNLVIIQVTANTIVYSTLQNQISLEETIGSVVPTGESPITDVEENASCRGLYTTSTGRVFTVFGAKLFEIFIDGTWEFRYDIGTGGFTKVSMTDDGFNLVLVDGIDMIVVDLTTNIGANITLLLQFTNPIKVITLNQRIVCINSDTTIGVDTRFYWSGQLDANTWDVLSFASTESNQDPNIAMEVREGEVWFFGPRSYEVWRIDENPDLPYAKVSGNSTEIGCGAANSVTQIGGQIFWIGSSTSGQNVVFMSQSAGAQRISNHAIETELNKFGFKTADAIGFSYQQVGHTFYVLTLIQANKTFVFDMLNGKWHERSSKDVLTNKQNRWDILFATFAFSTVIVGGLANARILTLDLDRYTEWDGRPITREHQGPIIFNSYKQVFHKEFMVDMETGVGLQQNQPYQSGIQTAQGDNPQIMLQFSDDYGHTWSSERWTDIGKVGQYETRARWKRLGRSRGRVYRIVISDPVKVVIIGARVTAGLGVQP